MDYIKFYNKYTRVWTDGEIHDEDYVKAYIDGVYYDIDVVVPETVKGKRYLVLRLKSQ